MLRFFRQIRKTLMKQNKIRSYVLYAVGEILLVVIGILFALQINNWNEESKLIKQEQVIFKSLSSEVSSNKAIIYDCLEALNRRKSTADTLQTYVGPKYAGLEKKRLNYLIGVTGSTTRCRIESDVMDELRSSGNLNVIRSNELRKSISRWSTSIEELKKEEDARERQFTDQYLMYTHKWVSWDDVDFQVPLRDSTYLPSKFEYDANKMLQQFEYANHLNNYVWRVSRVQSRLRTVNDELSTMDSLLTKQIN